MDIYFPREDSELILQNMRIPNGSRVLDMGTGSGILAAEAAKTAAEVVAADINPEAVREMKKQDLPKIIPIRSNLFQRIDGEFDVILFNAPYLPGQEDSIWSGGEQGRGVIERFLKNAGSHLKRSGCLYLLISSKTGTDETIELFRKYGFNPVIAARKSLFFETLVLIQATKI